LRKQRLQRCDIGWQRIGALAHANRESDSRAVVIRLCTDDSKRRSAHDVAVGCAISRA
jgi:hypothetical protein